MFFSRTANNTFKNIHEQTLKISSDNKIKSFFEVPTKSQYITNHHVQNVMAELFKGVNNLTDRFLTIRDNHYNLRSFQWYVTLWSWNVWIMITTAMTIITWGYRYVFKFKSKIKIGCVRRFILFRICKWYIKRFGLI